MKRLISKYIVITAVVLAAVATTGVTTPATASEPFLGQIMQVGFNFAPRGWAFCDGQLLPIAQNTALFSLLGTTFGGDGRTTFGLPDLKGRVAVHVGTGAGLSRISWGQKGGTQNNTLTINQMPSHNHTATATLKATDEVGNQETPGGHIMAKQTRDDDYSDLPPSVDMKAGAVTVAVGHTGGGQSVENRQPFLGIYHCIALVGIFPSRN